MFCVFLPHKREKFVVEDKTIHFGDVLRWSMCAQWSSRHRGGAKGCKKGEKKESREKYSLCAGGVDWRVVGDEEGGGGVEESFKAPRSCSILLRGPPGELCVCLVCTIIHSRHLNVG